MLELAQIPSGQSAVDQGWVAAILHPVLVLQELGTCQKSVFVSVSSVSKYVTIPGNGKSSLEVSDLKGLLAGSLRSEPVQLEKKDQGGFPGGSLAIMVPTSVPVEHIVSARSGENAGKQCDI